VAPRQARAGLLVLGVGNLLREDDGIGPLLVERLKEAFGPQLHARELYELDIGLAEELGDYERVLVIDAVPGEEGQPSHRLQPLAAAPRVHTPGGFMSHIFDWGMILALARDLYGSAPQAQLLAVTGARFGIGDGLSRLGRANAEAAFEFLLEFCSSATNPE
jgi:hydrogenase maturation protease